MIKVPANGCSTLYFASQQCLSSVLQIASLVEQTATNKDPYFVGLVAGTLYNVGRNDEAAPLAHGLEKFQVRGVRAGGKLAPS